MTMEGKAITSVPLPLPQCLLISLGGKSMLMQYLSCTCRGKSALLGREINLAPHIIFSYASSGSEQKEGRGKEISQ